MYNELILVAFTGFIPVWRAGGGGSRGDSGGGSGRGDSGGGGGGGGGCGGHGDPCSLIWSSSVRAVHPKPQMLDTVQVVMEAYNHT